MAHGAFDTHETGPLSMANQKAARAALGIPDEAQVIPFNLSRVPLFVVVQNTDDGKGFDIQASGTLPRAEAVDLLRHIIAAWSADE